jgi:6-phosphogluconolactonase
VPTDDQESNFGTASRELLAPLGIPETNIHRVRGELSPMEAAAQASTELAGLARAGSGDCPRLDLVVLGMGEDGHVASLFPPVPQRSEPGMVYHPVRGPKPPPDRVTLSYEMLQEAEAVWVLASGPGKERALAESLKATGGTPLGRVIQSRGDTLVYTDIPLF